MGRNTRLQQYINQRIRVTVDDQRIFVGQFTAFDRYMNLVMADAEEFRRVKVTNQKGVKEEREVKRAVGFMLIRGESVVSIVPEQAFSQRAAAAVAVL